MTEESGAAAHARTVLQQCIHARLQVKAADEESGAEWVEVGNIDGGLSVLRPCIVRAS